MNHFEEEFKKIIAERKEDIKIIIKESVKESVKEDIEEYKMEDIEDIKDLIPYTKKVKDVKAVKNVKDVKDVKDVKYDNVVNTFMIPLFRCDIYTNCIKCKHKKCLYL